jgi:hypothetical protein
MNPRLGAVTMAVLIPAIAVGTGVAALVRDDGRELLEAVAVVPPASTDPEPRGETTAQRGPLPSLAEQRPVAFRPAVALRRVEPGRAVARARTRRPAARHRARRVAEAPPAADAAPPIAVVAQRPPAPPPPAPVVRKPARAARPAPPARPQEPRRRPSPPAEEPKPEPATATTADPWDLVVAWAEDAAGMEEEDADGEDD